MKSGQMFLIVLGFFLIVLMITNPSIDDHRTIVMKEVEKSFDEKMDVGNNVGAAGKEIFIALSKAIVDKAITRKNYLLFSLTKLDFENNKKYIGCGILGNVIIFDTKDINKTSDENMGLNSSENNSVNNSTPKQSLPDFNNYPSGSFGQYIQTEIDSNSDKNALGQLEYAFSKGYERTYKVGFASNYEIVDYGVGAGCIQGVMIDLRDGRVYSLPIDCPSCENDSEEFYDFKTNSFLFINTFCDDKGKKTKYFLWSENKKVFEEIK